MVGIVLQEREWKIPVGSVEGESGGIDGSGNPGRENRGDECMYAL